MAASLDDPAARPSDKKKKAHLFTVFGTVLYIDPSALELRHGAPDGAPSNVVLVADPNGRHCRLMYEADTGLHPIMFELNRPGRALLESRGVSPPLRIVGLERGFLGLQFESRFLCAERGGQVSLSRPKCSLWECFLASEDWCTANAPDQGPSPDPQIDWTSIHRAIIDPMLRVRSRRAVNAKRIVFFANPEWSNGRVYYDLCKSLHENGYVADILNWRVSHTRDQMREMLGYYDFVISGLDGVPGLMDTYNVPPERIIGISHGVYYDFHLLIEKKGIEIFSKLANFGVVSYSMLSESAILGVPRIPLVASLGVNFAEFELKVSDRLRTVGYASAISHKTKEGIEKKRGELAAECAEGAGLDFRPGGTHANPISFHDMPTYYGTVDSILMTSMIEAAGLPVLEAAAAGRLVIGTPVGHFPLRAYQGGGIIAPIDANGFKRFTVSTLKYYKDNPQAYADKCHSIQEAARMFDWRYTISEWIELIETAGPASTKMPGPKAVISGPRVPRKGIICDINRLSSYLADEHYYLIRLLNETYGFDIVDSKSIDFSDESTLSNLNSYSVLIIAYQGHVSMPLDLISAYKILRVDDLVSYDAKYDEILNSLISAADMIISPYAYEFHQHFKHDSVIWVPYSSALEGCKDHERVVFNDNPICKILVSGSIAWDRPLRQYAAGLKGARIDVLDHPGYWEKYDDQSQAVVRTRYYEELSKYLCCFCDGHMYRYVHLKNFEIASAGSLLLTDRIIEKEMGELGFVDGQTCIFCDKSDFLEKVSWIVDEANRSTVDEIRMAGMKLVRERHMTRHRAVQINNLVNSCVASVDLEENPAP